MKIPRILTSPRLLLPTMIFCGVLIVGMRIGDIWDAASSGRIFTPTAKAQTNTEAKTDTKPDASPAKADVPKLEAPKAADAAAPTPPASPAPGAADASAAPPDDSEMSPAEVEVLKQLSGRREQLDKRGKELDAREALIKVAEQRVDQKIKEMGTLRLQLQSMVGQASEAQAVQIANLVKIYETMKPDDAAKIFETLDTPTLLGVVEKMKPARTAPILAKMTPEKAKEVTIALTKQDQLPQVK